MDGTCLARLYFSPPLLAGVEQWLCSSDVLSSRFAMKLMAVLYSDVSGSGLLPDPLCRLMCAY